MKPAARFEPPADAEARKSIKPVICYPPETLPRPPLESYLAAADEAELVAKLEIPPREARCWSVPAGHFCRIVSIEGPQVGDLNLFNANNLEERFYSGKTRALHGTHVGTGDRLYSSFPYLRPMATVARDSLDWYGIDEFGGSVHDVIGTRCDPYTHYLLSNGDSYHHCCHSNLCRALAQNQNLTLQQAEHYVHDVLNVFMCTGFTRDTGQYFMKASPVRPGDFFEFFAEIDILAALSACPGGDCSTEHSSDTARCFPLGVEVYRPKSLPRGWEPPLVNGYKLQ